MTTSRLTDSQRVVVTGLGATTPVGGDVASTWSAMLAGQSGVKVLTEDWVDMLPVQIAAPVAVDPSEVLPVPQIKRMDRSGQFALIAAREAWSDAGTPEVDPERMGVVIASGIGGVTTLLAAYDTLKERGARRVLPMTVPMLMPNGPAAVVGLELSARAGVHTPVSACSSGVSPLIQATISDQNDPAPTEPGMRSDPSKRTVGVEATNSSSRDDVAFVTETVRLLIQEGEIASGRTNESGTTSWEIRIPEGVREVIGRRLDRLSERATGPAPDPLVRSARSDVEGVATRRTLEVARPDAGAAELIDRRLTLFDGLAAAEMLKNRSLNDRVDRQPKR